jgi:signal transduction histidine kinase
VFKALLRPRQHQVGRPPPGIRKVELADIVVNVANFYTPVVEENETALALDTPHGFRVNGDPHLLSEALATLVGSAIKFTPRD